MVSISRLNKFALFLHHSLPRLIKPSFAFPPLHIMLETTYLCDLSCEMCQFYKYVEKDEVSSHLAQELSTSEIKSLIERLPRFCLFTLTGGEPFIRQDIVEVIEFAAKKTRLHIITNGTKLEKYAQFLVSAGAENFTSRGIILLGVSLQGDRITHEAITRVKGSFDKTIEGIKSVTNQKKKEGKKFPFVILKTVITKYNLSSLEYLKNLAEELGCDYFNLMINHNISAHIRRFECEVHTDINKFPPPQDKLNLEILKEQFLKVSTGDRKCKVKMIYTPPDLNLERLLNYYSSGFSTEDLICTSPWSKIYINPYGDVLICPYKKIGNIKEASLLELWSNNQAKSFRLLLKQKKIFPGCIGCCNVEFRRGG